MSGTKDLGKLWAERMTSVERDQGFPDSEPRDAATLMLIDRSGPVPKVLLGRRDNMAELRRASDGTLMAAPMPHARAVLAVAFVVFRRRDV